MDEMRAARLQYSPTSRGATSLDNRKHYVHPKTLSNLLQRHLSVDIRRFTPIEPSISARSSRPEPRRSRGSERHPKRSQPSELYSIHNNLFHSTSLVRPQTTPPVGFPTHTFIPSVMSHLSAAYAPSSVRTSRKITLNKPPKATSQKQIRSVVVKASTGDAGEQTGASRRAMLASIVTVGSFGASAMKGASADVGEYFSNLLVEKPPPPRREILLPELEVEALTREEGYRGTTGANKSKAQIEFAQFIAPIIEQNIDLDFGSYFRLALADLGTYSVVGKKNGLNGSIRFELDRPENKGLKRAFESIEKIKKAVDAKTTQPITYADLIAIVPHFAARRQFRKDYVEEVGDDKDYEFLFIGTNPFLGAKIRIGRRDAETADPEGLIPLENGTVDDFLAWFKRMGLGPNELAALAPYLYEDPQKGIDIVSQNGTCARLLDVYETQRILGKRAPGPAVTIIKNLKQMTDQCIVGGPLSVAPAQLDPLYVDYYFIKGGGEIPRVSAAGAYPGSVYDSGSKLAMQLRQSQAEQRAQAAAEK